MKAFQVFGKIRSTADAIWALLTDAPGYVNWNTTVDRVEGRIAAGEKVTIHHKLSPGRAFAVKATEFVPARKPAFDEFAAALKNRAERI